MLAARGKGRTGTGELAKAWAEERSSSSIVLRLLQLPRNGAAPKKPAPKCRQHDKLVVT